MERSANVFEPVKISAQPFSKPLNKIPIPIRARNLMASCQYALRVPYFLSRDLKLLQIVSPITKMNIAANKSAKETPGKTWKPSAPCSMIGAKKLKHEKIGRMKEHTIKNIQSPLNRSIDNSLSPFSDVSSAFARYSILLSFKTSSIITSLFSFFTFFPPL